MEERWDAKNPEFMILEAAPEKYIRRPSAALVALIRAMEGALAAWMAVHAFSYAVHGIRHWFSGGSMSVTVFLKVLTPAPVMELVGPGGPMDLRPLLGGGEATAAVESAASMVEDAAAEAGVEVDTEGAMDVVAGGTGGDGLVAVGPIASIESFLVTVFVVCVLVILVCTAVEALSLLLLRFALKGSWVAKTMRKGISTASVVLLLAGLLLAALQFYHLFRGGPSLTAADGVRPLVIETALFAVIAALRAGYHRSVLPVLSAVDFEIRLKFRETHIPDTRLSRYLAIQAALMLAAASLVVLKAGAMNVVFGGLLVEAFKYVLIANCWGNYKRCHM